jgi:prevent-host-death family protein
MIMKVINVHEAKAKLSEYLDAAAAGEHVVICKRNQPVAELRVVAPKRLQPRPVGRAAGRVAVPPSFFDPLPDDVADAFAGEEKPAAGAGRLPRVAEQPTTYRAKKPRRRAK